MLKRGTGKWAQAGVPHKGWRCEDIIKLGSQEHICEMCEVRLVRIVHVMRHADYPHSLSVGCICAGHMEENLIGAREREKIFKNVQLRRQRWLTRKWRKARSGNAYLNCDGFRVVVYDQGTNWGARVVHRSSGYQRSSQLPYMTSDKAKLAAFDVMIQMNERKPWRHC